jgi:AcrR family transcriptional regulator
MTSSQKNSIRAERRNRELALRRADVIAAASSVFAKKGYDGAQVSEIANGAEVSTKTVYALFSGKEEIYEAVTATAAAAVATAVRQRVEAIADPRERLLCVIDSLMDCFDENRDLLRIYAHSTHGLPWRMRPTMGEQSVQHLQDFTAWVIEIARKAQEEGALTGLDPKALSLSLIGAVVTTAAHWVESDTGYPLKNQTAGVRLVFERILGD